MIGLRLHSHQRINSRCHLLVMVLLMAANNCQQRSNLIPPQCKHCVTFPERKLPAGFGKLYWVIPAISENVDRWSLITQPFPTWNPLQILCCFLTPFIIISSRHSKLITAMALVNNSSGSLTFKLRTKYTAWMSRKENKAKKECCFFSVTSSWHYKMAILQKDCCCLCSIKPSIYGHGKSARHPQIRTRDNSVGSTSLFKWLIYLIINIY